MEDVCLASFLYILIKQTASDKERLRYECTFVELYLYLFIHVVYQTVI